MSNNRTKSLRTYLLSQLIFMTVTATSATFAYYYIVDNYFFKMLDGQYLEQDDIEKLDYLSIPPGLYEDYGLTVEVMDRQLRVVGSSGINPGLREEYSLSDFADSCGTDTWPRYILHTSDVDADGNELIILWIQDVPDSKMALMRGELFRMISLILAGIFLIMAVFIICYFNIIYRRLNSEFLYISDEITRLPHLRAKIDADRFMITEAAMLARVYNSTADEMKRIKSDNDAIIQNSNQLITDLSHDIKTPLTSIAGYSRLLKQHSDQSCCEYADYIEKAVTDLNGIAKMLFEQVRMRRSQICINQEEADIFDILRESCAMFYSQFNRKGVSFNVDIPEEQLILKLDKINIKRVFNNILDNFLKHSKAAGAMAAAEIYEDSVIIRFMNDGEPVDEKIRPGIFRAYVYDDKNSPGRSSGLGLYIAESIVEKHGGSIILTETEDYSTVFKISLPLR